MKFSVLMPVYVKESPDFLAQSLESILVNQSVLPNEVIIVEDGPVTHEIKSVLDYYFNKFPDLVHCFQLKKNMGMGYAMNYGLNKCKYEWVFRMDSDDISRPNRFKAQILIIQQNKYDVIGSSINEFNQNVGDINQVRILPENQHEILRMMKYRNPINHMTVAFNREKAIEAGGYWENRSLEDYNLWYEMSKTNSNFFNIQEVLVDARIGNNMFTRRTGFKYFLIEYELLKKFKQDGFINSHQFYLIFFMKLIARIIPVFLLEKIYKNFLRSKN
jgi:glycosyltransferase involved in cell wall biosynthesis